MEPESYWTRKQQVQWLYGLLRADGLVFPAGQIYEVLRQDGRKINLCSCDPEKPWLIGDTIVQVNC